MLVPSVVPILFMEMTERDFMLSAASYLVTIERIPTSSPVLFVQSTNLLMRKTVLFFSLLARNW